MKEQEIQILCQSLKNIMFWKKLIAPELSTPWPKRYEWNSNLQWKLPFITYSRHPKGSKWPRIKIVLFCSNPKVKSSNSSENFEKFYQKIFDCVGFWLLFLKPLGCLLHDLDGHFHCKLLFTQICLALVCKNSIIQFTLIYTLING